MIPPNEFYKGEKRNRQVTVNKRICRVSKQFELHRVTGIMWRNQFELVKRKNIVILSHAFSNSQKNNYYK